MADFDGILARWLAHLGPLGFDAATHLNPPATAAAIEAAEAAIGYSFTDELRALYRLADGQRPIALREAMPVAGPIAVPLFGGYDFQPLDRAVANYRDWVQILNNWDQSESGGTSTDDPHAFITRRDDDPVARAYWQPGWFPFAMDGGGNSYAADFTPATGGDYGQIILIGPDEDERRVLASGLGVLLERAAVRPLVGVEKEGNMRWFDLENQLR